MKRKLAIFSIIVITVISLNLSLTISNRGKVLNKYYVEDKDPIVLINSKKA